MTGVPPAARAAVAVVLGVGVAVGLATATPDEREADVEAALADPLSALRSDRLEATLADLAVDGVSVSDDGRDLVDDDGERAIEEAVRRADEAGEGRTYVVLWAPRQELGATESDVVELMAQRLVADPTVDRGHLLVWQGPEQGYVERLGDRYRAYGTYVSSYSDFVGDPAITLPRIIDELGAAEYVDEGAEAEESAAARDVLDEGGGAGRTVGSVLLGLLLGSTVVAAGWFVLGRLRRAPDPAAWRPRGAPR